MENNKRGKIETKTNDKGITISLDTGSRKIHTGLVYPQKVWKRYPKKEKLTENLAYLLTLPLPLVANIKELHYNTKKPAFFNKFQYLMLNDLPSSTFEYHQNPDKLRKQFISTKFSFSNNKENKNNKKNKDDKKNKNNKENEKNKDSKKEKTTSIVLLSFGKDSLLTLGLAREIGLNPKPTYINDTVSPTENNLKIKFFDSLLKEQNLQGHIIKNSIEKLNDFETWNREEMTYNYAHMITGFCFIALPLTHFYNSKYILLGNEKNFDFFIKRKGYKLYPAYDQTSKWTEEQQKMLRNFSDVSIFSLIRPVTDIAITKIIHTRYPELAKYHHSCYGLDASNRKRWCHDCNSCFGVSLFLTAFGINPKIIGLEKFFGKKHKKFYTFFDPRCDTIYDIIFSKEQELLSLLLATRQGERGYIIDKFKKYYLKEAIAREDELRKKYFSIYNSRIPSKIKPKVLSIYKEELKDFQ